MGGNDQWFRDARYGMFIHYGLYAMLERGEWVMNKEAIPIDEYKQLANRFTAAKFNADDLIRRAKEWGMRYAVLTTKHHEGFCLYDSKLTDFTAPKSPAKRDLVREFVEACRKHGLKIGLYHTLNDWTHVPNAVDALEKKECYQPFIDFVHAQIREIMTNYGKIDVMWYDGWWPFDGKGWQGEKLNAMVRSLQPGILINSRNGVKGDFSTPEGHITASAGMWEACITLNDHWGYHRGDVHWKSPLEVAQMLQRCASLQGNLLLNVGPRGDGSVPEATVEILDKVGRWVKVNGEAIYGGERFSWGLHQRGDDRSDWNHHGRFSAGGDCFYWHIHSWPGTVAALAGLECKVKDVTLLANGKSYPFTQKDGRLQITGLPEEFDTSVPAVFRVRTDGKPCIYRTGGCRNPKVPHCRYDPVASDIVE